jgi:hypothetical protein
MSTFHAKHQLDQTMDTDIKRIQLIGIFSESVLLIIGVVLFFLDYQLFALLLAIMALGGLVVFLKIIPDSMRKKVETLQSIQPFIELDHQKIRHGEIIIPWEQVSAILRAVPEHVPNEHSPIQSSDTVYLLITQELTPDVLAYSSFVQSYGGHPYLTLQLSYFEKPEVFTKELEQIIQEKNISFLETKNVPTAEKFFQETYKRG